MTYAEQTTVTPDRSKIEIERTLMRYGADMFSYGWDDSREVMQSYVCFRMKNYSISHPLFLAH
jgi:hypothetical protein